MKKIVSIVIVLMFLIGISPGCGAPKEEDLREILEDELRPVSSIILSESEANRLADKTPVKLYFANSDNTKLRLEIRYIDTADAKKSTSHLATIIIQEIIKGPSDETAFRRTVPAEAKLRTPVSISGKVATVDMSKEFATKHPGGKEAEKMTIYSIVNSLTELEGIEKVKFTIAGKVQKEYKGNFKFDGLFPRNSQLIGKEAADTAVGGSGEIEFIDGLDILE